MPRRIFRDCGKSATGLPSHKFELAQKGSSPPKNHGVTASCEIYVYCREPTIWVGTLPSREAVLPLMYCVKEDGLHFSGQDCRPTMWHVETYSPNESMMD
jgi:hypothetical protein